MPALCQRTAPGGSFQESCSRNGKTVKPMRKLFLVSQEHGGPWDWSKGLEEQTLFAEHARFVDDLVRRGVIVLGGPLDDQHVLLVVNAPGEEDVRAHFVGDPWMTNGMVAITAIRPWTVLLDSSRDD
jgi:uncharacterized protein YciI